MTTKHKVKVGVILLFISSLFMPREVFESYGYQVRKIFHLNIGSAYYDFKSKFKYNIRMFRISYNEIVKETQSIEDKLLKQNIKTYFIFSEGTETLFIDPSDMNLSPLQVGIYTNDNNKKRNYYYDNYSNNNTIFASDVIKKYSNEFTKMSEKRWIRQDGHWSIKQGMFVVRELLDKMGVNHDFYDITFKEIQDDVSTETRAFRDGKLLNHSFYCYVNADRTNVTEIEKEKYLLSLESELHFKVFSANAKNDQSVLWIGDSFFQLMQSEIFPLFKTNYWIHANYIDSNLGYTSVDFDIQKFIDTHEIDTVVIETHNEQGIYLKMFKFLNNNLN